MSEPDDNELVQGCLDGDERAFEILLLRYQGPVFNAVLRMVRHRDEATDLTQTAFLKAYEQLKTFDQSHKFFSWLYRIAINEAISRSSRWSRNFIRCFLVFPDFIRATFITRLQPHHQAHLQRVRHEFMPGIRADLVIQSAAELGLEFQCAIVVNDGFVKSIQLCKRDAQVIVGIRVFRHQFNHTTKMLFGVVQFSYLLQRQSETVQRPRIVGLQANCRLQMFRRLVEFIQFPKYSAEMNMTVGFVGPQ